MIPLGWLFCPLQKQLPKFVRFDIAAKIFATLRTDFASLTDAPPNLNTNIQPSLLLFVDLYLPLQNYVFTTTKAFVKNNQNEKQKHRHYFKSVCC